MENEPQHDENNIPEDDQFLSALLDGAAPGEDEILDPEADPQAVEGQPDGKQEPKADDGKPEDKVDPEPAPAVQPPATDAKTWEYRGKQYTLEQMVELGILDDVIQTARQFPTIQTKYQSLLEEKTTAPAPGDQAPAEPTGPSGDQILTAYTPVVEDMANKGYIEPEVMEVFPKLATALMFHRDLLYDVRSTVAAMLQNANAQAEVTQKDAVKNYVGGLCDKVAGEGDHFATLRDQKVRDGFFEYLGTLNVPVKQVNDDFIRKQWVAYNADPMLEAVRQAAAGQKVADSKTRRNARGEGGGVRPAPSKQAPTSVDQAMIESFLE